MSLKAKDALLQHESTRHPERKDTTAGVADVLSQVHARRRHGNGLVAAAWLPRVLETAVQARRRERTLTRPIGFSRRRRKKPFKFAGLVSAKLPERKENQLDKAAAAAALCEKASIHTKGPFAKVFTHLEKESDSQTHLEGTSRED